MTTETIEFWTEYPPGKDPVDWVLVAPRGAAFQKVRTPRRVKSLMPPEGMDQRTAASEKMQAIVARWQIIGPKYAAFKAGQELPEDGTPLAAWPGVDVKKADILRRMGIRTVEAVRDMGEDAIGALRWPGAREMPKLAKLFLEGEDAARKDAKIAELEERMAAMVEVIEEQQSKPRRGRPPKEAAA